MAIPVLLLGASGSGKSASMRNFKNEEYALINVMGKQLPFKNDKKFYVTTQYPDLKQTLLAYSNKTDCIVVDDAGYLIVDQFVQNHGSGKGNAVFDLYNTMAQNFYNFLLFIQKELPAHVIVYIVMHEERSDLGYVKPKTIGRMLDEKIDVAGLFTVVLNATKKDGKYIFKTQTDGFDVTKSPMGMFESTEIDNDLKYVQKQIKEYYNL
ncbi:MAG: hypothetical protein RBS07_15170 [Lentimicrobium sp.]|nr:hypothetical protein [Lentimicrobium sp.]